MNLRVTHTLASLGALSVQILTLVSSRPGRAEINRFPHAHLQAASTCVFLTVPSEGKQGETHQAIFQLVFTKKRMPPAAHMQPRTLPSQTAPCTIYSSTQSRRHCAGGEAANATRGHGRSLVGIFLMQLNIKWRWDCRAGYCGIPLHT